MPEPFPARWIHGSASCATNADPPLQVHAFDDATFILRQNKCANFEGPFLYLLLGSRRALLLDTGATPRPGSHVPLRQIVDRLIKDHERAHSVDIELIITHSHGHEDHLAGDSQFDNRPRTRIVGAGIPALTAFFRLTSWPDASATFDLGDRALEILPIPGHFDDHIALYDPRARILLTGDTLYAGKLVVNDWSAYTGSAARLRSFAAANPIRFVLGAHVEMKRFPGQLYAIGSTFQPDEQVLQLEAAHLVEWASAVAAMGDDPVFETHDEFVIAPASVSAGS